MSMWARRLKVTWCSPGWSVPKLTSKAPKPGRRHATRSPSQPEETLNFNCRTVKQWVSVDSMTVNIWLAHCLMSVKIWTFYANFIKEEERKVRNWEIKKKWDKLPKRGSVLQENRKSLKFLVWRFLYACTFGNPGSIDHPLFIGFLTG